MQSEFGMTKIESWWAFFPLSLGTLVACKQDTGQIVNGLGLSTGLASQSGCRTKRTRESCSSFFASGSLFHQLVHQIKSQIFSKCIIEYR